MMVLGLEFVQPRVKQEPGRGGMNTAIGIMIFLGRLTGTFVSNDANNNGWDASSVRGYGNVILVRDM